MRGLERPRHACPELDEGPAFAAVKVNARPGWKSELPCPRTTWVALGTGSVALATDERDFGRDECYFLKLDGFSLPMHKIDRKKTSRCSPPSL